MTESTVTALEMRRKFGGILDRVAKKGEHITIVRGNRPLATLVPATEHQEQCLDRNRVRRVEEFFSKIDAWQKANANALKRLKGFDSTAFIRKMRRERFGHR